MPRRGSRDDVTIGPYSIVGADVTIGAGTVIGPHVVIGARTRLGERNRIFQFASIGEIAQDRKYGGEPTTTTIGDDNTFREYATVHARHRAGSRRHRHRQRQSVPRLHARRARLRGRQPHDVLQQRADRGPRAHRRLGRARRVRRRAPVLPRRRACDARRVRGRAAGRAAVRDGAGLSGQAARHQQRGPAPARLHARGHPARSAAPTRCSIARTSRSRTRARSSRPTRAARRCWRRSPRFSPSTARGIVR